MIRQYVSFTILILWFIYTSYGFITPLLLIQKEDLIYKIIQHAHSSFVYNIFSLGFQPNIYYTNEITKTTNKVDILICNHVSSIDSYLIYTILKHFGIYDWISMAKKELTYIPGFGFYFLFSENIKVSRDWEKDKLTFNQQLEKIKDGIIIVFPEGTRFEPKKLKEGQEFSKQNNLPVFDNLLVPKAKGLFEMIKYFKNNERLGKVFDMSIIMKNFFREKAHLSQIFNKEMGDVYLINRELILENNLDNYDDFKKWLMYNVWKKKDDLITLHKNIIYKKMKIKYDYDIIIINLLFMFLTTYLLFDSNIRMYFLVSIVIAYMMIFIKNC